MTLAGIELRYLINNISEKTKDYYVSNIYGINRDSLLFKLHHPQKADILLMVSPLGLWISSIKIEQIEPNKLLKRLRNDLLRLKLEKIDQIGAERIAYLNFVGFDKDFILVAEFFGEGNIILCNKEMKILALLHSIDVRHRQLRVGLKYSPPPQKGKDIFEIQLDDIKKICTSSISAAKWIGRTLGLPTKYVEEIFKLANVDSKKTGVDITDAEIQCIYDSFKNILRKVVEGDHNPVIVRNEKIADVYPIILGQKNQNYINIQTFNEGLDILFTETILESGRSIQTSKVDKKITELKNQLTEQNKAIDKVKEKSKEISNLAKSIMSLISKGITSIKDPLADQVLNQHGSIILTEKGVTFIRVLDEKIRIDYDWSLPKIASCLYDEAKKQSNAIASIQRLKEKTEEKLEKQMNQSERAKESVTFSNVRKKNWFERYRWFYTSDDFLAIGGRDSSSNSAIIRKHLEKNDKVFHAEIHGSPFFILKNGKKDIPSSTLSEVAHATVCFSRAWKEEMPGMNAFWVEPDQVKKAAPSGQFLPKGSFIIEGQRNFVNIPSLKLAVGILEKDNEFLVTCGPPDPIKRKCICYVIIEPGGIEMVDAAKKIKFEFSKLNEAVGKAIDLDEITRVLPAGKSHVVASGLGGK